MAGKIEVYNILARLVLSMCKHKHVVCILISDLELTSNPAGSVEVYPPAPLVRSFKPGLNSSAVGQILHPLTNWDVGVPTTIIALRSILPEREHIFFS